MVGLLNAVSWGLAIIGILSIEKHVLGGTLAAIAGLAMIGLCAYLEWMYETRRNKSKRP